MRGETQQAQMHQCGTREVIERFGEYEKCVNHLLWPPQSPDLSWALMGDFGVTVHHCHENTKWGNTLWKDVGRDPYCRVMVNRSGAVSETHLDTLSVCYHIIKHVSELGILRTHDTDSILSLFYQHLLCMQKFVLKTKTHWPNKR